MTRKKIIQMTAGLVLVVLLGIGGIYRSPTIENPAQWGETMGTSYSIKITGKVSQRKLKRLHARIEAELKEINRQMSTWDPESEISRFNHSSSTNPITGSSDFVTVVKRALEFSKSTGGAFDPTLQPLLNLWGFGSEGEDRQIPTAETISRVRNATGWEKVERCTINSLRKSDPKISLALGGIAKGYGVDAVAKILKEYDLKNWFVEIGGEVVVSGMNGDGVPWKVGIQHPTINPMDERVQGILHMTNGAIATSGDYRNYIKKDGKIYSHILDPRTGQAIHSGTASVTVLAPCCTDADGIATALFVMGPDEALPWVERHPEFEALFLVRGEKGEILEKFSSGFVAATRYSAPN